MSTSTTEARIRAALGDLDCEDWVTEACRVIHAWRAQKRGARIRDVSTVGKRLNVARMAAGLTIDEFARRLLVPRFEVLNWFSGKSPLPVEKLRPIGRILEVSIPWLLMETDDGAPAVKKSLLAREKSLPRALARKKAVHQAQIARAKELNRMSRAARKARRRQRLDKINKGQE